MVFFSGGKGGGEMVDYGYKGKGMTTHLLVEGNGYPLCFEVTSAKGDERQEVEKLLIPIEGTYPKSRSIQKYMRLKFSSPCQYLIRLSHRTTILLNFL